MNLAPGLHWLAPRPRYGDSDPREGGYYIIDAYGTEHGPFGDTEILELLPEAIECASRRFDIQILLTQEPRP